jgi:TolB-like protein/Tfp pilus assembly protein PilF
LRESESLATEASRPAEVVAPGAMSALLREIARVPHGARWDSGLRPGLVIGRFELVRELGRGGFGVVYQARDLELGRSVAFKGFRPAPGAAEERLFGEAEAAARLSHPNIVTLHDVGRCELGPYLILELLRGETLAARMREGPLPPGEATRIATDVARGLAHAHAHGVVHRDLTPRNVFLCEDGQVKVLDFGLAHVFGRRRVAAGTPGYMAPEQWRGAPEDERTDVFALGVILYEALSGRLPFPADRGGNGVSRAPPPLAITGAPGLGPLVARMLAEDPVARPRDGAEVLAALASLDRTTSGGAVAAPAPEVNSIAILPFTDMSSGRDQGYLCEGLAEELINVLTQEEGLRVAARISSFQFRGPVVDLRDVGRQLGVATLLQGSVRKAGNRLRITVQLVDVATGYHRWSQRFDRTVEDIFAIEDEIAENVARCLRGAPPGREAARVPQTAVDAYEWYLRARQLLHQETTRDLSRAREMFERAIELDPAYAPAWAGLATVHAMLYEWMGARDDDLERAERAAAKALELGPELADGHVARGFAFALRCQYEDASREFEEAIRINPRLFDAYYFYARACFADGQIERSAELFRKASDVRPEDFQSPILLAQSLRMLGRTEEARVANHEGVLRAERALVLNPVDGRALSFACALYEDGQRDRALEWSRRSIELYPDEMVTLVNAACLHAKLGLKEEALRYLERVFARGWGKRDWVDHDPDYDSLRDDPRFKQLVEKLK